MGNHASHNASRGPKDGSAPPTVSRFEGHPINIDKPKPGVFKSQQSEDDHEPVFCKTPKSPDEKENSAPVRYVPQGGNVKYMPNIIRWQGGGNEVYLRANFLQGNKLRMIKSEKDFLALIDLPVGEFEYSFEVDGEVKVNPNEEKLSKEDGSEANVISIKEEDFEELENELLKDPNDGDNPSIYKTGSGHQRHVDDEDDGYGQKVPEYKPTDKIKDPPVLPPHLLQVILNKDTPVSCEPTLLPEPNHVIVNHMYALSIRDGMMVLSTTHRYKKKSVTTLIYRPI